MINIYIVVDGEEKRRGPCGFANMIQFEEQYKQNKGGERYTTLPRMAISATIRALGTLSDIQKVDDRDVIIYSDDSILVNSISKKWIESWQQNNWMKSNGYEVRNVDLWKELLNVMHDKNITIDFFNSSHDTIKNNLSKIAIEQQKLASEKKCID